MSAIDKILSRLNHVRRIRPDRWRAWCPAHECKSHTLSLGQDEGRVLIHCFAGCSTEDVLGAIGLGLRDLYDKPLTHYAPPIRNPFHANDVLDLALREAMVLALISDDWSKTGKLSGKSLERITTATRRLNILRAKTRVA